MGAWLHGERLPGPQSSRWRFIVVAMPIYARISSSAKRALPGGMSACRR
jgi:hypothetical protein